jgi:hypothetical protein
MAWPFDEHITPHCPVSSLVHVTYYTNVSQCDCSASGIDASIEVPLVPGKNASGSRAATTVWQRLVEQCQRGRESLLCCRAAAWRFLVKNIAPLHNMLLELFGADLERRSDSGAKQVGRVLRDADAWCFLVKNVAPYRPICCSSCSGRTWSGEATQVRSEWAMRCDNACVAGCRCLISWSKM